MAHSTVSVNQLVMKEFERPCCNRGYHVYQEIWTAAVDEELVCEREPDNSHDRYAVVAFATSRLAKTIACDGIDSDKGPLGLGRPSFGLKKFRIDIAKVTLSELEL